MNESHQPEPVNIEGIENLLAKAKALEVHPHEAALAQIAIAYGARAARSSKLWTMPDRLLLLLVFHLPPPLT
ncbi:MAG: hypothetical protein GDA56_06510 [Hormoscilla sp. GM7CHS1pb]|nr:hypothetical protein [Hormoscilla sp. GM7CHS1pb]